MSSDTPDIHFKRITAQTVIPICKLSETLSAPQRKMVADNALSIAQGITELVTSCGLGEQSPEGFYKRLGFAPTGEKYGNEIELKLILT